MSLRLYMITLNGLFRLLRETEIQNFVDFVEELDVAVYQLLLLFIFFPLPTEM